MMIQKISTVKVEGGHTECWRIQKGPDLRQEVDLGCYRMCKWRRRPNMGHEMHKDKEGRTGHRVVMRKGE